jgi:hypothetical protein
MVDLDRRVAQGGGVTWLTLTIMAFATYYISYCVSNPAIEGPFGALQKLRDSRWFNKDNWAGRGIRCIVCVSLYVATGIALIGVVLRVLQWDELFVYVPGLAGLSVFLDKFWKAR